MSHTVKFECPQCGASDWYRYSHRLWVQGYSRRVIAGKRVRVLAASPLYIVRCRGCGVAFSCSPPGGRHQHGYLLPVDSSVIEQAEELAGNDQDATPGTLSPVDIEEKEVPGSGTS